MQEAERLLPVFVERTPVTERSRKKGQRPLNVRANELARIVDRPIHVAFGREVDNRRRAMLGNERSDHFSVADITLFEPETGLTGETRKVSQVPSVRQLVQRNHRPSGRANPVQDEIRTDKSGTTSYEDCVGDAFLLIHNSPCALSLSGEACSLAVLKLVNRC
jgi:hypothetical protein